MIDWQTIRDGIHHRALMRSVAFQAFSDRYFAKWMARGIPTSREERWKYNNLKDTFSQKTFLPSQPVSLDFYPQDWMVSLVFVNGYFDASLSDIGLLPKGLICEPISQAISVHANVIHPFLFREWDENQHPFAVLNTACVSDGLFLFVPDNMVFETTIHLVFFSTDQNDAMQCPRNIIIAGQNSKVTLIEDHRAQFNTENVFTNTVTELHAKSGATIEYIKIQDERETATHIANVWVEQEKESQVNAFFVDKGAHFSRTDLTVSLREPGAKIDTKGLYLLDHTGQQIDHHVTVDHVSPNCTSSMIYKGVLWEKSQAVFNGRVHIFRGAEHTVSHQESHHLLLSADAEINAKPELEVYADNVKCTHGATAGQLDVDALFYLRSRGLTIEEAMALLTQAFISTVLYTIKDPSILEYLQIRLNLYEY